MSAPAVIEISTERLILRRSIRRNAFGAYERMTPFHGRSVELWALET